MTKSFIAPAAMACALAVFGSPAAAQEAAPVALGQQQAVDAAFARFVPRPSTNLQLDWMAWQDQLRYMVLRMGPSTRDGAPRVEPTVGTRFVYGHDSRIRLEGNRIPFSLLPEEAIPPLSEYRADLERIGSELDIATLPRDEQLAYWINLHNVAVIEKIALNYPVRSPSLIRLNGSDRPLDETPFITVAGVRMSPKDIRTKIVFPNWDDPKVIYGFFRGEIGGPTIPRDAYTAANVKALLTVNGGEFVNSLRGVESYGGRLRVSAIFVEAAPFYFPAMQDDLRAHLRSLADDQEVKTLLAGRQRIAVNTYVDTIADLAGGEREPQLTNVVSNDQYPGLEISPAMARLMSERARKYETLLEQGKVGRVIILPNEGEPVEAAEPAADQPEQPEQ